MHVLKKPITLSKTLVLCVVIAVVALGARHHAAAELVAQVRCESVPRVVFTRPGVLDLRGTIVKSPDLALGEGSSGAIHVILSDEDTGRKTALRLRRGSRLDQRLLDGRRYVLVAHERGPDEKPVVDDLRFSQPMSPAELDETDISAALEL
jgi:hypothetical protein